MDENNAIALPEAKEEVSKEKLDNAVAVDYIMRLKDKLYKDELYNIIVDTKHEDDLFTPEILDSLEEHKLYSTMDIENLLGLPMSTSNNWFRILGDYIGVIKRGRYNKIDGLGLLKIKMIYILKENNSYSLTDIKKLLLPQVNTGEIKEKETASEKLKRHEEKLEELEKKLELKDKQMQVLVSNLLDFSNYDFEKQQGEIGLNRSLVKNLLADTEFNKEVLDKVDKIEKETEELKESTKELKEDVVTKKELEEFEEKIKTEWAKPSKEEVEKLLEQFRPKKSLFGKIIAALTGKNKEQHIDYKKKV